MGVGHEFDLLARALRDEQTGALRTEAAGKGEQERPTGQGVPGEHLLDLDARGVIDALRHATQSRLAVANASGEDEFAEREPLGLLPPRQREGDHLIGRGGDVAGDVTDAPEHLGLHRAVFRHDDDLVGLGQPGSGAGRFRRQADRGAETGPGTDLETVLRRVAADRESGRLQAARLAQPRPFGEVDDPASPIPTRPAGFELRPFRPALDGPFGQHLEGVVAAFDGDQSARHEAGAGRGVRRRPGHLGAGRSRDGTRAEHDLLAGEFGGFGGLACQAQPDKPSVAGEKLRQAGLLEMPHPVGRTDGPRLLEFDVPDEFRDVRLEVEGRGVAAQGLLAEHADDAARGGEGTAGRVAPRPVGHQAFQPFAGGAFALALGGHPALEDEQGPADGRRGIHPWRAQAQATVGGLGEIELGDDFGEDREAVALRRGTPAPPPAGEREAGRTGLHGRDTLGRAAGGRHDAGRTRESRARPAVAERLKLDLLHVPGAFLGGGLHETSGSLPGLLGLGVLGET